MLRDPVNDLFERLQFLGIAGLTRPIPRTMKWGLDAKICDAATPPYFRKSFSCDFAALAAYVESARPLAV